MADELLADDGVSAKRALDGPRHRPRDLGHILRHTAEHFAIEILDDLLTTGLPHRGGGDLLPVLQRQDVRQLRVGIGQRLVIVGVVRRLLVAARPRAQCRDAELLHHVLVIFLRRPFLWRLHAGGDLRQVDRRSG